jgi:hypothetical protein
LGVPDELRVELWKDFLTVSKHENDVKKYLSSNQEYAYKSGMSPYENLREQALLFDAVFYEQLELDIRNIEFPHDYK